MSSSDDPPFDVYVTFAWTMKEYRVSASNNLTFNELSARATAAAKVEPENTLSCICKGKVCKKPTQSLASAGAAPNEKITLVGKLKGLDRVKP